MKSWDKKGENNSEVLYKTVESMGQGIMYYITNSCGTKHVFQHYTYKSSVKSTALER